MNTYRSYRTVFAAAVLGAALAACGPIYRTEYSYHPPTDASARQCLNQCLGMRELCRATAENRAAADRAACQQAAMLNYTTCLATAKTDAERGRCSSQAYCQRSANTEHCDADYRLCYANCGGSVTSRQVCVAGC